MKKETSSLFNHNMLKYTKIQCHSDPDVSYTTLATCTDVRKYSLFSKNNTWWLELLIPTVSVRAYSTASSWHFPLLMPCTPAVTGWAHCWIFSKVLVTHLAIQKC